MVQLKFNEDYAAKTKILALTAICSIVAFGLSIYLSIKKQNAGSGGGNEQSTQRDTIRTEGAECADVSTTQVSFHTAEHETKLRQEAEAEVLDVEEEGQEALMSFLIEYVDQLAISI